MNRYFVDKKVGSGTFGSVFLVHDDHSEKIYALKQIRVNDSDIGDDGTIHPSRELFLNQYLMDHSDDRSRHYFANMIDHFYTERNEMDGKTIWNNIVLEFEQYSLSYAILHNLELNKIQLVQSIIEEMSFLHSHQIIHRDLKPSNILLSADSKVKLCDFGCSKRIEGSMENHRSTPLVTSRFYRAPELLMGATRYGTAIDIWSLGCVIVEIFSGTPLFVSLESDAEQLVSIINILGTPTEEELAQMQIPRMNREYLSTLPSIKPIPLDSVLPRDIPKSIMRMIGSMLQYDPSKRPSATELLSEMLHV